MVIADTNALNDDTLGDSLGNILKDIHYRILKNIQNQAKHV